jgi:uncharacterized membrane protein
MTLAFPLFMTLLASIGFVAAVTTFLAGFVRAIKKQEQQAVTTMHRVNGYITLTVYIIIAFLSIVNGTQVYFFFAWVAGLLLYVSKILLVKKGLAVRYGGYFGFWLLMTWVIIIFTHLPG